jgi:carbon storage regulator
MLVLSRKRGEAICIGDEVFVSIIRIRGNRVQLGIQAPDEISVFRTEIVAAPDESLALEFKETASAAT